MSSRFAPQARDLPAPVGVVYNTSMARADAALALAALYVAASRRHARVDGVCVTGSGFDAAVFCDIVARFYTGTSRAPSSNTALPVGFPADAMTAPSAALVEAAVKRTRADGQPQYVRTIQRMTDTAAPDALLRNALTLTAETILIVSAPATWIARSLALAGTPALYRKYVKRVIVVDAGDLERDAPANETLVSRSGPVLFVGREVGDALSVPVDRLRNEFPSSPPNPVADAIAAAPERLVRLQDVAAVHYGLYPGSGYFTVNGARLAVNASTRDECLAALVSLATSKPGERPARG